MAITSLTLYQIEDDLLALLDTEAMVAPEQQAEFERDLAEQLRTAIDKRERVGQFLRFCELQSENCDAEIERLQDRKHQFCRASERMREYVVRVIESMGPDDKGKMRKLDGHTIGFSLRAKPGQVEIANEADLPVDHKRTVVTVSPDKVAIKKAIESGLEVPGADLSIGGFSLVVK